MSDFLIVLSCGILALIAHGSVKKPWLGWILRGIIFLWFGGEALYLMILSLGSLVVTEATAPQDPWVRQVTTVTCVLTGLTLFKFFRQGLSYVLTAIDCLFSINFWRVCFTTVKQAKAAYFVEKIFVPTSMPHMCALFIYICTTFYLLGAMSPKTDFKFPGIPLPMPVPLEQLFSYNFLGLVVLAFCGVGIFVSRKFKEVLVRLALVKPRAYQVSIGIAIVFGSFAYDYLWSVYTHGLGLGLDNKLSMYNAGTFSTAEGGLLPSAILALATAVFAGVGEETLIRGALQPVFGIVPAAILHGLLHAQFQHAPIFIVQVSGWSILMGLIKRYTNTTTTIIGHAGFNLLSSFLFAFNP